MRDLRRVSAVLLLLTLVVAAISAAGCVRKAEGVKDTSEVVYHPRTGAKIYERHTGEHLRHETPADASGPSRIAFSPDTFSPGATEGAQGGILASDPIENGGIQTAGSHEKPLEAYLGEQRQKIFYFAGIALIVIGIAGAVWVNKLGGVVVALAGFGLCFMPEILRRAGGPIAILAIVVIVLAVIVGLTWAAATLYRKHRNNLDSLEGGLKLAIEGKASEAVAAMRGAPIVQKVIPKAKAQARASPVA